METPFLRPDDPRHSEIFADAAWHLLGGSGIDRFSVRAIARWMKVAPATILGEYSRGKVLELIVIAFERRWLAWSGSQRVYGPRASRIPLSLPSDADERLGVRVLSALQHLADAELVRGNSVPAAHLDQLRQQELGLLRFRLTPVCCPSEPDEAIVAVVMAFIRGLRLTLSEGEPRLAFAQAVDLLHHFVQPAVTHTADCVDRKLAS